MSENIYQKMLNIRKNISYIQQKNYNEGQRFHYVSSSQVLEILTNELNQQNIILEPEILERKVTLTTNSKGNTQYFTELDIEFTFINIENIEEKIKKKWYSQGLDSADKGVGKALTYAEKFFLLKYFNIATDKHDPDSQPPQPPQQLQSEKIEKLVDNNYIKKIYATLNNAKKDNEQLHIFIKKAYNKDSIKELTIIEADNVINRLKNPKKSI